MVQGIEQREVVAANDRFYAAIRSGDLAMMDVLWSTRDSVSVYHPNWPGITGREEVMASWHDVLVLAEPPEIFPRDVTIIRTERMAYVICVEEVGGARMTASNVFIKEAGEWLLTCHHARPLPIGAESKKNS